MLGDSVNALYEGRILTLNDFRRGIFPIKTIHGKGRPRVSSCPSDLASLACVAKISVRKVSDYKILKILTPK